LKLLPHEQVVQEYHNRISPWIVLMLIRYELIIYWSDADQSFVVEVPALPGCMADGETYEQAVANAQRVIAEWIETARELGRPVPEYKGRLKYALSIDCVMSPACPT
jgi:predicted RNase H-like HicB family nuclease